MLQTQTVAPELLELLNKLMNIPDFKPLLLVGGTALALQLGHRKSVVIDLFGAHNIDKPNNYKNIQSLGEIEDMGGSKSINIFRIDNIKVDIVNYPYRWIGEKVEKKY